MAPDLRSDDLVRTFRPEDGLGARWLGWGPPATDEYRYSSALVAGWEGGSAIVMGQAWERDTYDGSGGPWVDGWGVATRSEDGASLGIDWARQETLAVSDPRRATTTVEATPLSWAADSGYYLDLVEQEGGDGAVTCDRRVRDVWTFVPTAGTVGVWANTPAGSRADLRLRVLDADGRGWGEENLGTDGLLCTGSPVGTNTYNNPLECPGLRREVPPEDARPHVVLVESEACRTPSDPAPYRLSVQGATGLALAVDDEPVPDREVTTLRGTLAKRADVGRPARVSSGCCRAAPPP